MQVPSDCIGWVAGNRGSKLRRVEEESGCYCFLAKDGAGDERPVIFGHDPGGRSAPKGRAAAERLLNELILEKLRNDGSGGGRGGRSRSRGGGGGGGRTLPFFPLPSIMGDGVPDDEAQADHCALRRVRTARPQLTPLRLTHFTPVRLTHDAAQTGAAVK